jgi:hypothetical protein
MNKIWKYELQVTEFQQIEMPLDAELLDVQVQHGAPCLWARVNPCAPMVNRVLVTHGTGHDVAESTGEHVGSYQLQGGALVFHVFEAA